jgi:hypothetical protein
VEHLPVLDFAGKNTLYTADKDSGIHYLELGLVGLEEFEATKNSPGRKGHHVCSEDKHTGEHSSTVELLNHRQ